MFGSFDDLWSLTQTQSTTSKLGAVLLLGVLAGCLARLIRGILKFLRVGRALKPIPEAPGANWLLGHVLPCLAPRPWETMNQWVLDQLPVVRIRIFHWHIIIVGSAKGLKTVFQTRYRSYDKDIAWSYQPFMEILGTGLVTSKKQLWQKQRLLIGPVLKTDILDLVLQASRDAVDRLSAQLEAIRGTGTSIDMGEELRLLTLQVIGQAVLNLGPEECNRVFPRVYLPVMEENNKRVLMPWRSYLPLPAWFHHRHCMRVLNSFLIGHIQQRWRLRQKKIAPKSLDLLERILAAIEASGEPWSSQIETQLCYEIKTLLLAGHETSAAMLTWSLYELTQHPDSSAKVKAEAEQAFGAQERRPSLEAVEGMQYTLCVLKESLRKYPVVPVVTRGVEADEELCGYKIPRGTVVIASMQSVHSQWASPRAWQPERFMPGGEYEQFDEDIRPYMFIPFIAGPRTCLGQNFTFSESRVVLGLLTKRFSFTPAGSNAGETHESVIPVGPANGMHMLVR